MTVTWMNAADPGGNGHKAGTKRIASPVATWPGYMLLYDPIPLVNAAAFESLMREIGPENLSHTADSQSLVLPVLLPCVAEWHLEGFPDPVTIENFPGTPRNDSSILISRLIIEVAKICRGGSHVAG